MGTSPKNIETRADGRPPEEAESDDPEEQAGAILEDSEERLQKGARDSAPRAPEIPQGVKAGRSGPSDG